MTGFYSAYESIKFLVITTFLLFNPRWSFCFFIPFFLLVFSGYAGYREFRIKGWLSDDIKTKPIDTDKEFHQNMNLIYSLVGRVHKLPEEINLYFLNRSKKETKQTRIKLAQFTICMTVYCYFLKIRYLLIAVIWYNTLKNSPTAITLYHFFTNQLIKLLRFVKNTALFFIDFGFTMTFSKQKANVIMRRIFMTSISDFWIVRKLCDWEFIELPKKEDF